MVGDRDSTQQGRRWELGLAGQARLQVEADGRPKLLLHSLLHSNTVTPSNDHYHRVSSVLDSAFLFFLHTVDLWPLYTWFPT